MSDKKYNLDYLIEIEGRDGTIYTIDGTTDNSLTIDYNTVKTYTTQANTCNLTIYNLNETLRNNLKKTKNDISIRGISLSIGYNKNLTVIFSGTIKECYSERNGENYKTIIIGWDGGEAMINSKTNITITNDINLYERLASDLTNIKIGYITPTAKYKLEGAKRGTVLSGKTWELLKEYQDNFEMFIDNMQLYIMKPDEYLQYTYNITAENGILNTPRDFGGTVELELLAEPNLRLKGIVNLTLKDDITWNGQYEIIQIENTGTISKIGGNNNWRTILTMTKGEKVLKNNNETIASNEE